MSKIKLFLASIVMMMIVVTSVFADTTTSSAEFDKYVKEYISFMNNLTYSTKELARYKEEFKDVMPEEYWQIKTKEHKTVLDNYNKRHLEIMRKYYSLEYVKELVAFIRSEVGKKYNGILDDQAFAKSYEKLLGDWTEQCLKEIEGKIKDYKTSKNANLFKVKTTNNTVVDEKNIYFRVFNFKLHTIMRERRFRRLFQSRIPEVVQIEDGRLVTSHIESLNQKLYREMILLYKKHFSEEEVKQLDVSFQKGHNQGYIKNKENIIEEMKVEEMKLVSFIEDMRKELRENRNQEVDVIIKETREKYKKYKKKIEDQE
ncbi:hypothetical protein KJ708_03260 [bacterium]|nr:hypothetical protein [bacterium]